MANNSKTNNSISKGEIMKSDFLIYCCNNGITFTVADIVHLFKIRKKEISES